jgi:hypothetical protein
VCVQSFQIIFITLLSSKGGACVKKTMQKCWAKTILLSITLLSRGCLGKKNYAKMLGQNHFAEPNRHNLTLFCSCNFNVKEGSHTQAPLGGPIKCGGGLCQSICKASNCSPVLYMHAHAHVHAHSE